MLFVGGLGGRRNQKIISTGTGLTGLQQGQYAPAGSFTLTATSPGSTYNYRYAYGFKNENLGTYSNAYPDTGILCSASTVSITIGSLPAVYPDPQSTHICIYRTKDAGATFYLLDTVAEGVTSYLDTVVDTSLSATEMPTRNGVMPAVKYLIDSKRRIFAAGIDLYSEGTVTMTSASTAVVGSGATFLDGMKGRGFQIAGETRLYAIDEVTTTSNMTLTQSYVGSGGSGQTYYIYGNPNYVYYSEIDATDTPQPEYCHTGVTRPNFINFTSDDGDFITGLGKTRATTLLVFKQHQVWALSGNSYSDFNKTLVHPYGGTNSHWTITNDSVGLCYYYDQENGVFVTDGTSFNSISEKKIDDFLHDFTNTDYSNLAHAVFYPKRGWYMLWVCSLWASSPDICLVWDTVVKEWFILNIPATCSALIYNDTTRESEVWVGDAQGFVHKLDQENVYNYSAGSVGTIVGSVTSVSGTLICDTLASYNTVGDGHKSCYLTITAGTGAGQKQLISSNTESTITLTSAFTVTPVVGESQYAIGAMDSYYYSKWNDLNAAESYKKFYEFFINYLNQATATNVTVRFYPDFTTVQGTVAVTNGSATVTGTNTLFSTDDIGKTFRVAGHNAEYIISNVSSQTSITLNKLYKGTTKAAARYIIEIYSRTFDMNTDVSAILDCAMRAKYCQFRIGMNDSNKNFTIYSVGFSNMPEGIA